MDPPRIARAPRIAAHGLTACQRGARRLEVRWAIAALGGFVAVCWLLAGFENRLFLLASAAPGGVSFGNGAALSLLVAVVLCVAAMAVRSPVLGFGNWPQRLAMRAKGCNPQALAVHLPRSS